MTEIRAATMVLNRPVEAIADDSQASADTLALFQIHGAPLYRFARVMLRDPQDAEDIVQTAFLRLLHHLKNGGDRTNLTGWLFTVAANLCRDQLRRRTRWLPWLPEHERLMTVPPDLQAADPQQLFLETIRTLAPRDRMLLALRAQGLSYREIAAATRIRETSVGRLLARAMSRWQRAREAMLPA